MTNNSRGGASVPHSTEDEGAAVLNGTDGFDPDAPITRATAQTRRGRTSDLGTLNERDHKLIQARANDIINGVAETGYIFFTTHADFLSKKRHIMAAMEQCLNGTGIVLNTPDWSVEAHSPNGVYDAKAQNKEDAIYYNVIFTVKSRPKVETDEENPDEGDENK